jgi:hypothetical protein
MTKYMVKVLGLVSEHLNSDADEDRLEEDIRCQLVEKYGEFGFEIQSFEIFEDDDG